VALKKELGVGVFDGEQAVDSIASLVDQKREKRVRNLTEGRNLS
jgi:hypothetical protein